MTGTSGHRPHTWKFDTSGELLWSVSHRSDLEAPAAVAVAARGGVFLASDTGIFKLDGAGREVWFRSSPGRVLALAVDHDDNLTVTGEIPAVTHEGSDPFVAKYASTGEVLWERRPPVPRSSSGRYVASDSEGNVYVVAHGIHVFKFSAGGALLWARGYVTANVALGMGLDGEGNAYVLADNVVRIKYAPGGERLWVHRDAPTAEALRLEVAIDGSHYVFAAHSVLLGYSSAGELLWRWERRGFRIRDVATDRTGAVYVAGGFPLVQKLDHRGGEAGTFTWGGPPAAVALAPAVGSDEAVYVTGEAEGDLVTVKLAPPARLFVRGDCDGQGGMGQVSDAVVLLRFSFSGGETPPCMAACDADGDGRVAGRVHDAIYMLQFSFRGGPPPAAPYPECGSGNGGSDARLGCAHEPEACR